MKKVRFEKVGMENFRGFIDTMELDLERNRLVLITGPNGIGKTTLFDAIAYTLYGVTSNGARGPDVVNDKVERDCHTWLTWSTENGSLDKYRVDRYYKHRKHGNDVYLKKNETVIKKGHNEVVPEVSKIVMPQKLFMNTLFFSQKVKDFFTDLTDSEQKEIFRKILSLDNYVLYFQVAGKKLEEIEHDDQKTVETITVNKRLLEEVKLQISTFLQEKTDFYTKKEEELQEFDLKLIGMKEDLKILEESLFLADKGNLDERLEEVNGHISQTSQKKQRIENEATNAVADLDSKRRLKKSELEKEGVAARIRAENQARSEVEKRQEDFRDWKEERSTQNINLQRKVDSLKSKIEMNELAISLKSKESKEIRENVLEKEISVCPTCYREIDEKTETTLKEKVANIEAEANALKAEITTFLQEIDLRTEEKAEIENSVTAKKLEADSVIEEINRGKNEEISKVDKALRTALDKLEEMVLQKTREIRAEREVKESELIEEERKLREEKGNIEKLLQERTELTEEISQKKSQIGTIEELRKQKEKETYNESLLLSSKEKEVNLLREIKDLEVSRKETEILTKILKFWREGFSPTGIPSMLIDDSTPFMNKRISQYLDQMGGRYTVSFDTLKATKAGEFRDKISVNVFDSVTHANSRVKFSGGQTRLVDIATIVTLADLQTNVQDTSFNLLLFDEIFDSLDDENISYVSKLLRTIVKDKAIFLISHRHIDQIEADEVLSFYQ